jgi:hypothetical protein
VPQADSFAALFHCFSLFLLSQSGRRKHGEVLKTAGFSRTRYEPEVMPEQPGR